MVIKNDETPTAPTDEVSNLSVTSKELTMNSVAIADRTINVPFHGSNLFMVSFNNEPYVPMKPVVEGMGMVWSAQFVKLKQRFAKGVSEIEIPSAGGKQAMTCLAFRKFSAWLSSIQPNKVKPEIRDRVIQYQEECDDVLYEYWTKGEVKNPRKAKKELPGKITPEQQEAIKQLVMNRGKALPKESQAKGMITLWSSLKSHFGCSYKEISEDQFTEALSLAARVPLEGEFLGKQELLPAPSFDWAQHLKNMQAADLHMNKLYYTLRSDIFPALRRLGSPIPGQLNDHLTSACVLVSGIMNALERQEESQALSKH